MEKRRPVDILQQMLEERSSNKMEQFFKSYGAAEVASMCFSLITSTPTGASAVSYFSFESSRASLSDTRSIEALHHVLVLVTICCFKSLHKQDVIPGVLHIWILWY